MRLIDVKREQMIDGMDAIIRRVCRLGPQGDLVLMHDEMSPRELAIKLLSFVEGRDPEFVRPNWPSSPRLAPDGNGVICDQCGRRWDPAKGERPLCIECAAAWARIEG